MLSKGLVSFLVALSLVPISPQLSNAQTRTFETDTSPVVNGVGHSGYFLHATPLEGRIGRTAGYLAAGLVYDGRTDYRWLQHINLTGSVGRAVYLPDPQLPGDNISTSITLVLSALQLTDAHGVPAGILLRGRNEAPSDSPTGKSIIVYFSTRLAAARGIPSWIYELAPQEMNFMRQAPRGRVLVGGTDIGDSAVDNIGTPFLALLDGATGRQIWKESYHAQNADRIRFDAATFVAPHHIVAVGVDLQGLVHLFHVRDDGVLISERTLTDQNILLTDIESVPGSRDVIILEAGNAYGPFDVRVKRLTAAGNEQWRYETHTSSSSNGDLVVNNDGSVVLAHSYFEQIPNSSQSRSIAAAILLDSNGNYVHTCRYGNPADPSRNEYINSIERSRSGILVMSGSTYTDAGGVTGKIIVADSDGSVGDQHNCAP